MRTLYDFDGTLIQTIKGDAATYKAALETVELTKLGKQVAAAGESIVIATARPSFFKAEIEACCKRHGIDAKVLPLGSMFGHMREDGKRGPRKLSTPSRKLEIATRLNAVIVDDEEANLIALGDRGIDAKAA